MAHTAVYYSRLWYSRFMNRSLNDFDANIVQNDLTLHLHKLRILSVFFETIYIPRTHFLTTLFGPQVDISRELVAHNDFRYLADNGIVRISTWPELDVAQDTDRIIMRATLTDRVAYAADHSYLNSIPRTLKYNVDTRKESSGNSVTFPQLGKWLSAVDSNLGQKFDDIVSRSGLEDIPFFHEHFIRALKDEFDRDTFEALWRKTNSIYLTSGVPGDRTIIPYFDEEIEAPEFRYDQTGLDRYLFNPNSLHSFLSLLLTSDEMAALLYGPIEKSCRFCSAQRGGYTFARLREFREEYEALATKISRWPKTPEERGSVSQLLVSQNFIQALEGRSRSSLAAAGDLIGTTADAAADLMPFGNVIKAAGAFAKLGVGPFAKIGMTLRFPGISTFTKMLKYDLGSARE